MWTKASTLNISQLSSDEVSFILSSNCSFDVLERTELICLEKAALSPISDEVGLFSKTLNFIYTHPLELVFVALSLSIICLSIYNFAMDSGLEGIRSTDNLHNRVENLEDLMHQNSQQLANVSHDVGILKSFFRNVKLAIGEQTSRIDEAAVRINQITGSNLAERGILAFDDNFTQSTGFDSVGYLLGGVPNATQRVLTTTLENGLIETIILPLKVSVFEG